MWKQSVKWKWSRKEWAHKIISLHVIFINVKCPDFNFGDPILFDYLLVILVNCWHGFYWCLTWCVSVCCYSIWHCSPLTKLGLFRPECIWIDIHSKKKIFKSIYYKSYMKSKILSIWSIYWYWELNEKFTEQLMFSHRKSDVKKNLT